MLDRRSRNLVLSWLLLLVAVWAGACGGAQPTMPPAQLPTATETRVAEVQATETPPAEQPTPPPASTSTGAEATVTPPPSGQASAPSALAGLQGLPLDRFFDESFKLLMLRDPEWVTTDGLAARFGTGNDRLTDLSDAYIRQTQQLQAGILTTLRAYDRAALTPEQQISYDVYEWYLDDLVRGQEFMYDDYPINPTVTGIQNGLFQFFTDIHPIASRQDAEDYITRLSQVDDKFEGLIEGLRLRKEEGVVLPKFLFPWVMGDIRGMAGAQPKYTPFYTAFAKKVDALPGLSAEEKQALLQKAETAIGESVIPAFAALAGAMDELAAAAPAEAGVWQFPQGEAYYNYVLRHYTTTDLTADQIHELGLKELERIHGEMRAAFAELGYPADASIPDLYARLAQEGGTVSGNKVAETYEALIHEAEGKLDTAFERRPKAAVGVVAGPLGDFYVSPSLDGSRPGMFYARVSGSMPLYSIPTVAYHETVPGHHLQIALAQESDLPLFRNDIIFNGYTEGWALYAEQLAYELGWYKDDPYGSLGRLQDQAFRAARLVVDTGLHAKQWTYDQALNFMIENVGRDPGMLQSETGRYVAWPGQATAYMVGMLEIQELRQKAMNKLGDRFDLKEFHAVVLDNGSMPLEVLERVVDDYIASK